MKKKKKVQVIIVHGSQVMPDNTLSTEHRNRCDLAFQKAMSSKEMRNHIVVTGGQTITGRLPESDVAFTNLRSRRKSFPDYLLHNEPRSRTTGENISFAQELLREKGIVPDHVVFICRNSQVPKVRVIAWRLWYLGNPTYEYIAGVDYAPIWYKKLDTFLMPLVSFLDPTDSLFLLPYKKFFRNG